ncbi:MAG: hypothetical protein GEV10_00205 [Streptosporangiales bacterium]|nr:hypothetical protein [Streptosporangiales bacterium]
MTLTERLVDRVLDVRYDTLGTDVVEMAKHVCLDGVGVILAGYDEPLGVGRLVTRFVEDLGGAEQASVFAAGFKTSVTNAAFANGTMAHALDFDNTWYPLNHPMSPTLPAILALAEHHGFSGRDVITAIATAFEVQGRLRLACTGLHTGRGFHKPGMTGTMGATAAAVKLLGLDRDQAIMAFGISGSRAGSLSLNTGTMTKSSHSGHAARMGVESAMLASMGWTATSDVFGPRGFFDTFLGDEHEDELLLEHFAEPFRMVDPGVGFKKHPSNYFTHRPIDAALAIRAENTFDPGDVTSVEVRFPRFEYVDRPRPESGLDGKFSVQYTTATALLDGRIGIGTFTNERRFARDVDEFLAKVHLVFDDDIPNDFQDMHVVVTVTLGDGRVLEKRVDELSGMHGVPLSRDQRTEKFLMCCEQVLTDGDARKLMAEVEDLEKAADVRTLTDLARGTRGDKRRGGREA